MVLGRTFRRVDRIALPVRTFVLENPARFPIQVVPHGTANGPVIQVVWQFGPHDRVPLRVLLDRLQAEAHPAATGKTPSVPLLGHYRFVCPPGQQRLKATSGVIFIWQTTIYCD